MITNEVDINDFQKLQDSFSKEELRGINRVCDAIAKGLQSSARAFEAIGEPLPDHAEEGQVYTHFLAAIEPARLEAALRQATYLQAFWHQQWRGATGRKARIFRKAADDLLHMMCTVKARLDELAPIMAEEDNLFRELDELVQRLTTTAARIDEQRATQSEKDK